MDKLKELLNEMKEIELHDADIDQITDVISKSKSRIDYVLDNQSDSDDQDILASLKEVSNNLSDCISILTNIQQGNTDDGKE